MSDSGRAMPQSSESQEIGRYADFAFVGQVSDNWIPNGAQRDYGWDYWIALRDRTTGHLGADFFVQLKGTGYPGLVAGGEFISQELRVTTINYLLNRPCPALLAVCDLSQADRPVYWVWLHQALPNWGTTGRESQGYVTVRVPRANRLKDSHAAIEEEVARWLERQNIDRVLAEVVAVVVPGIVGEADSVLIGAADARQRAIHTFAQVGLLDASGAEGTPSAVSEEERRIRIKLSEAKVLIDRFADRAAHALLDEAERAILDVPVSAATRALLWNRRGVLALRGQQHDRALEFFTRAAEANPDDDRYRLNLVTARTLTGDLTPEQRAELLLVVEACLQRQPDSEQATCTKARLLVLESPSSSVEFLKGSHYWANHTPGARLLLADLLATVDPGQALEALGDVPTDAASRGQALSLRGFILFMRAVGQEGSGAVSVRGFGPASLDMAMMNDAADAYEGACHALAELDYPRFGEEVVRNAVQAMALVGRAADGLRICDAFLSRHPQSLVVREGAGVAAMARHDHDAAVEYLTPCVAAQPGEETPFRNLLLALYSADRFEELKEHAEERVAAPASEEESRLCLELLALAHAGLGDYDRASLALEQLQQQDEVVAAPVVAAVWSRQGRPRDEIRAMLQGLALKHPGEPSLAAHLASALLPVSAENASEIRALLEDTVARHRRLHPSELEALGRAHAELGQFEQAEAVFRRAVAAFPEESRLALDLGVILAELGRPDEAYEVMTKAARSTAASTALQQNLAWLALRTDRLAKAISLFESARHVAQDPEERRAIAGQVFELRRRRGDSPKELLRAARAFGEIEAGQALPSDVEARFLMMCFIGAIGLEAPLDAELLPWRDEFQVRLKAFCDAHPDHPALRRVQLRDEAAAEGLAALQADLMAQRLPSLLFGQQLEMASRSVPFPLCFRARRVAEPSSSTVTYWQRCVQSSAPEHRVRCLVDGQGLDREAQAVPLGGKVVVDVTALLTLRHLGLLDEALQCFSGWVVAEPTRAILEAEATGMPVTDAVANELFEWLQAHRREVNVRRVPRRGARRDADEPYSVAPSGLWMRTEVAEERTLPDGVGASVMLAAQVGLPLLCDEGVVRQWASERHGVSGFGAVALLRRLRTEGRISPALEAGHLLTLLDSNYRDVPVGASHLHAALLDLVGRCTEAPDSRAISDDRVCGGLIRFVGDPDMSPDGVIKTSAAFLGLCIADDRVPPATTDDLACTLASKNQMRVPGGPILGGLAAEQTIEPVALLWAWTLVPLRERPALVGRAWSLMRGAVARLHPNDPSRAEAVAARATQLIVKGVDRAESLSDSARKDVILGLVVAIPDGDRRLWYEAMK